MDMKSWNGTIIGPGHVSLHQLTISRSSRADWTELTSRPSFPSARYATPFTDCVREPNLLSSHCLRTRLPEQAADGPVRVQDRASRSVPVERSRASTSRSPAADVRPISPHD